MRLQRFAEHVILQQKTMSVRMLWVTCIVMLTCGLLTRVVLGDCPRPANLNPNVIITPDQPSYLTWYYFEASCPADYDQGGPTRIYCQEGPPDYWSYDPSTVTCSAPCYASEFDRDVKVTNTTARDYQQTMFDHNENAYFSCARSGDFVGANIAICGNGTFIYSGDEPSCLAYCQVPSVADGLQYTPGPNVNVGRINYFVAGITITFTCADGYEDIDCTSQNCSIICDDGTWNPDSVPTCVGPSGRAVPAY